MGIWYNTTLSFFVFSSVTRFVRAGFCSCGSNNFIFLFVLLLICLRPAFSSSRTTNKQSIINLKTARRSASCFGSTREQAQFWLVGPEVHRNRYPGSYYCAAECPAEHLRLQPEFQQLFPAGPRLEPCIRRSRHGQDDTGTNEKLRLRRRSVHLTSADACAATAAADCSTEPSRKSATPASAVSPRG